jgi:hypothetical protein
LQPAGTLTTTVANLPPLVTTVEILARRRDGTDPTPFDMADFYAIPSGSSAVGSAPLAPVGDHTNLLATLTIASSTTVDFAGDLPLADTATVDAAQMVRIGSATHYDVASHTVHWTESSFGVDPTALVAQLTWRTGTGTGINMQVVAPHTGPALVIPPLPAALQSLSDTAGSGPPMPGIHARVYASKTYDDVLNGRIGDTAVWHTAF